LKIPIGPSQEHHAGSSHGSCSQLAALLEDELFELQEVGWDLGNWATGQLGRAAGVDVSQTCTGHK